MVRKFRRMVVLGLFLSAMACGLARSASPTACVAAPSPAPTKTLIPPTETPTVTPTPTETATPTPEVKQYPICAVENFRDCPIPVEDLFNGEYLRWFETLFTPFDPAAVADYTPPYYQDVLGPNYKTGELIEDFTNVEIVLDSKGLRRDKTAGYAELVKNGITYQYLVLPVELYDPQNPRQNQGVITIWPIVDFAPEVWNEPIVNDTDKASLVERYAPEKSFWLFAKPYPFRPPDPLFDMVLAAHPELQERLDRFAAGDMTALSSSGIILIHII
jgi:hypothetical protein